MIMILQGLKIIYRSWVGTRYYMGYTHTYSLMVSMKSKH